MEKLRNKLWLWGQDAGSHKIFNLPGESKMSPEEGAKYFGISNICRVVMSGSPKPPFEEEAKKLDNFDKVVWSVVGDGSSERNDLATDVDAVAEIARSHKNISGGILDDFLNKRRLAVYSPEMLADLKKELTEKSGREMELWTVLYQHELANDIKEYVKQCDVITYWTWSGEALFDLNKNIIKAKEICNGKRFLAGCYLFNYGDGKILDSELMHYQLKMYYKWLKDKTIEGVIICSNCCSDIGLETVGILKKWIDTYGDEII